MPKFIIERNIPGLGKLGAEELRRIAQRSNSVVYDLGPNIQWVESFVTADKMYCVYIAPNAELIRLHARCGAFPCDDVAQIREIIDPVTGGA